MNTFKTYLNARDQQHLDDATVRWNALTEREQLLVREAAVMGFVQGIRAVGSPPPSPFPGDRDIVIGVLDAAPSFFDLYPTLTALGEGVSDE